MTLGQRIQELRRQNNLSQEALGDRLGVSRQAISKWESDTTIPEVDKLITMSKQFGVPVGVLLGVEEPATEPEQVTQELTDRELTAVETIVSRYIEQMEQLRPEPEVQVQKLGPGWKRGLIAAAVIVLLVGIRTVSNLNRRIDDLNRQTGNVQSQMINVENTVTRQIYSLSTRLEELLEAQGSLLLEHSCVLTDYIPGQKAIFSLSARPKEYIPEMTAVFYVESRTGETVSQPAVLEDGRFSAEISVPLWDDPAFSVELDDGQSRKTQPIKTDRVYMLASDFGLIVDSWGYGGNWYLGRDDVLELDLKMSIDMHARTPGDFNANLIYPEECVLTVYYNGKGLRQRFLSEDGWSTDDGEGSWHVDLKGKHTVDGVGQLEVILTGRDNFGEELRWELMSTGIGYGRNEKTVLHAGATMAESLS